MQRILDEKLAVIYQALSHPKRLELLDLLRDGEHSVCQMMPSLNIRQANLSQHLNLLRSAGLVVSTRRGSSIYYRIKDPRIFEAIDRMRYIIREQLLETRDLLNSITV